jgi:hypothetical protein
MAGILKEVGFAAHLVTDVLGFDRTAENDAAVPGKAGLLTGIARVLQADRAVVGTVEFRNHWDPSL